VSGCRGCLGRLLFLILVAWGIGTLAKLLGWSDTTTGSIFLVVLALLAIRGSNGRRISRAARVTRRPAVLEPVRQARWAIGSRQGRMTRPVRAHHVRDTPWHAEASGRARDPLPAQLRFRILARAGFRCRCCGRSGSTPGVVLHVDHVVPLAAGGTSSEGNLRTACEECNLGKGTRAVVADR
jgi:5-methylcytosine-specific restriction endonuclease McrA